jgi:hypothetical protein
MFARKIFGMGSVGRYFTVTGWVAVFAVAVGSAFAASYILVALAMH